MRARPGRAKCNAHKPVNESICAISKVTCKAKSWRPDFPALAGISDS
jgi:hypothetical protein